MSLRHTLLGLLDWTPLHGYALREIAKGYAWLHPMSNTNIYPSLRQLEEEGFVVHREEVVDGRIRKVYETTQAGKEELRRWLRDPTPQRGVYRDPTLLKITMLRKGALEGSLTWIDEELQRCRKAFVEVETILQGAGAWPRYARRVTEHGRDALKLRIEFFEDILASVKQDAAEEEGEKSAAAGSATGSAPPTPAATH